MLKQTRYSSEIFDSLVNRITQKINTKILLDLLDIAPYSTTIYILKDEESDIYSFTLIPNNDMYIRLKDLTKEEKHRFLKNIKELRIERLNICINGKLEKIL